MNSNFTFVILTFNEEIHLPRLLNSIKDLNAQIYILDSGSTDDTLEIVERFKAEAKVETEAKVEVKFNKFINHPKQWDFALKAFQINTPWIIGLDADQTVSKELFTLLQDFNDEDYANVNGIYFNRKNYFQGSWVRFGGYFPFYQLKMFRNGIGFSDLNENMDHRFVVTGATHIWENGYLIEENLKENDIKFWFAKHEKYSDLIAEEEIEREQKMRMQTIKANLSGNPDERRAWFKKLWWKLPLGIRPYLYFIYRMTFKLGIFDNRKAIYFHYLQGLWFRLLVDKKIKLLKAKNKIATDA